MKSFRAKAYSSSANLGPGYDIMAMAHTAFHDVVQAEIVSEGRAKVSIEGDQVPLEPEKNSAGLAVLNLLQEMQVRSHIKLSIQKGIPAGLGLGSSGASAAAAVYAVDQLLGLALDRNKLTYFAMLGEQAAAGAPHPDNVAASVFGKVVIVYSLDPLKVAQISPKGSYGILLVIPQVKIEAKTKKARELVPSHISMGSYVANGRRLASLVVGLMMGERGMVRNGMEDEIVERARMPMFPYYPALRQLALRYDAVGVCVSGAGPSVMILTDEYTNRELLANKAREECSKAIGECMVVEAELADGVTATRGD